MIEKIDQTDQAPIAGSWEKLVNTEKFYNLAINKPLNYDFTGNTVKKGVVIAFGGSNYIATANTAITGTPSSYVKIDSNGNASYVVSLAGVTWSDTYNFWNDALGNAYLFDESKAVVDGEITVSKTVNSSPSFFDVMLEGVGAIKSVLSTLIGRVNQSLTTTSSPTFASVNTGQGDNELYKMDQNVRITDDVTFEDLTVNGFFKPKYTGAAGEWTSADNGQAVPDGLYYVVAYSDGSSAVIRHAGVPMIDSTSVYTESGLIVGSSLTIIEISGSASITYWKF